jgi:hypothetical protein
MSLMATRPLLLPRYEMKTAVEVEVEALVNAIYPSFGQ